MNLALALILLIVGSILIYDGFTENNLQDTINKLNKNNVVKMSGKQKKDALAAAKAFPDPSVLSSH
jgi:hypothetical protein